MKTMDDLRNLFLQALQQETDYLKKELPSHLFAIINGYLQGGGKRLRPCLLLMCAQAVGGDVEKALPAAVAVEEFHTWTLIHDDVIDHDDFRRGNPTGHILGSRLGKEAWKLSDTIAADYGISAAILAGDSLQARATEKLFELKDFQPQTILSLVSNMTGLLTQDLLAGEQLDVEMSHMAWDRMGGGKVTDECLVAVTVAGTQVEIAMRDTNIEAGTAHEVEERHRVTSPADSEEHPLPVGNQMLLANVGYELL